MLLVMRNMATATTLTTLSCKKERDRETERQRKIEKEEYKRRLGTVITETHTFFRAIPSGIISHRFTLSCEFTTTTTSFSSYTSHRAGN